MAEVSTREVRPVAKPQILVVDKKKVDAKDLRDRLRRLGYEVPALADSGTAALEKVEAYRPDLALVDIGLDGDMDGIEVAQRLRHHFEVPVIFLTPNTDENTLERTSTCRPCGYLIKPYQESELRSAVKIALEKGRSADDEQLERRVIERTEELRRALGERRGQDNPQQELAARLKEAEAALERESEARAQAESSLLRQSVVLSKTTSMLVEKDRLLQGFQHIGKALLGSLERDRILDILANEVVKAAIFPSILIAQVDAQQKNIVAVRSVARKRVDGDTGGEEDASPDGDLSDLSWPLDGDDPIATTVRTGAIQIKDGDRTRSANRMDLPSSLWGPVSFYIPVCQAEKTTAVLVTGCTAADKSDTLQRIAFMQPLIDQVAIALEHARLYAEAQIQTRQLIRLERLRALGEMAVGVSHNLNNLLVAVLVPAQFLLKATKDPEILREASDIVAAGRRAADLVRRLHRSVQIRDEEPLEPVAIGELIEEAVASTRPKWKDESERKGVRIRLETEIGTLPLLQGIVSELHEVLTNLIFNAVDALPAGGRIWLRAYLEGEEGVIAVGDNGVGMDEEVRRRVFEPFFTTKDDVGTGLGLSTVYNTVTRCGGNIDIDSEPGRGSTFTVRLPLWKKALPEPVEAVAEDKSRTSGRILVVEDDAVVRQVLNSLLEAEHQVETTSSGSEAIEWVKKGSYDVALIDLGMPEMRGDLVAEAMRQVDPTLATVLITGWQLDADHPSLAFFDFYLQKPFNELDEILHTVGEAVDLHRRRMPPQS
jgi:signal transduction histidine kinase/DNA-binding response OmpR family regulator